MYQRARKIVRQWGHFASIALLSVALASLLSACGENDECASVTCDFGVCQAGQCQNPSSCSSDLECLPGSVCSEAGVCQAQTSCQATTDCEVGVCAGGTCVNPESCQTNDDCLPRTFCGDDNTCQPDPCNTYECEAGQCLRGTETCVSKDTCTLETEAQDCLNGDKCLDGTCYAEEAYCEALACESGVCSFEERACVNADSCGGDDANCLEGFYCAANNECAEDLCVVNNIECSEGVCVPSTGDCHNAQTCEEPSDCVGGYWCVDGTCRAEAIACGDEGCPGNQICEYDEDELSASCIENPTEACSTSLDCRDGRQCAGNTCLEPFGCEPDRFEPNNTREELTDFNVFATAGSLEAGICSGDTDVFSVDLEQFAGLPLRGQMVITATYATRDIGLGELQMRVIDPNSGDDGTVVGTDTSGEMGVDGKLEVKHTLNAASSRQYLIEITDTDNLSQAGVSYTLSVDMTAPDAYSTCESPTKLVSGSPVNGDTSQSEAYVFGSSCTSFHHSGRDEVYSFELTRPSRVSFNVLPRDTETDFSLSLRSSCDSLGSEIACEDLGTSGGELLRTLLDAGTYYVIVQSAEASGAGGSYTLTYQADDRACAPATNYCADRSTAQICNAEGTSNVETVCSLGCNPSTGTCVKAQGEACDNPTFLSHGDTETITWSDLENDHELAYASCLDGTNGAHTRGADAVYAVRVGANEGLQASLALADGDEGAIYLVETCHSMRSSCLAGADENAGDFEVATYINETGVDQTLYLVVDSAAGNSGTAELSVDISPIICTPGAERCDGSGHIEVCNEIGVAYRPGERCLFGCIAGACDMSCNESTDSSFCNGGGMMMCVDDTWEEDPCPAACSNGACEQINTCTNPSDITAIAKQPGGTVIAGPWGDYSNNTGGSGCGVPSTYTDGADIVLTATLAAGETLDVHYDVSNDSSWDADPAIAITSTCGNISSSTCLTGANEPSSNPFSVSYTSTAGETVFIIVDTDDLNSWTASEEFEITVTIQ